MISFAQQAALALELGEKNRAQRQIDVLADRDRIARDLHDHVIQRLFATGLKLQSTLRRSTRPECRNASSRPSTSSTRRSARSVPRSSTCTPRASTTTGCAAGCSTPSRTRSAGSGHLDGGADVRAGGHGRPGRPRVGRAGRHPGGGQQRRPARPVAPITVTLEATSDELLVEVVDDGVGIEPDVARSGLHNLEERAAGLGGRCRAARAVGGTRVAWRVPLA